MHTISLRIPESLHEQIDSSPNESASPSTN